MEQPIVEFKQICKQYDAGVPVISDLNLTIEKGEFICIVGPSGCGKSTLLHLLGGFFDATSGEIFIDGKKVLQPSRDCGIVFQDCSIPNAKNILDTVALGEEVEKLSLIERFIPFWYNYRRKDILERARAMLKKVGLENDFHKFPSQLSGGQKQRVAIARALLKQPKVLLMDEPFSALDPQTRTVLQLLMLDIQRETKTTTFFVTHSIDEAVFLADRVVVLSQYHKQGQGSRIVHIERIESFSDIEAKKSANYAETIARIKEAGFSANQADEIERRQKHLKKLSEMEVFNAT